VPFVTFARDDSQEDQLASLFAGVSPVLDALQPPGTAKEALNDFVVFLHFLEESWPHRPGFSVSQLALNVFSIVSASAYSSQKRIRFAFAWLISAWAKYVPQAR
jgi:hypothetical protein